MFSKWTKLQFSRKKVPLEILMKDQSFEYWCTSRIPPSSFSLSLVLPNRYIQILRTHSYNYIHFTTNAISRLRAAECNKAIEKVARNRPPTFGDC